MEGAERGVGACCIEASVRVQGAVVVIVGDFLGGLWGRLWLLCACVVVVVVVVVVVGKYCLMEPISAGYCQFLAWICVVVIGGYR